MCETVSHLRATVVERSSNSGVTAHSHVKTAAVPVWDRFNSVSCALGKRANMLTVA